MRPADVTLRSILESNEWKKETNPLSFAVGKDISGNPVIANLAQNATPPDRRYYWFW